MPKTDIHGLFTRRLKKARTAKGLTQTALGMRVGLTKGVASTRINRYEVGTSEPDLCTAERMAKKLGVSLSWLVCTDPKLAAVIEGFSKLDAKQQDTFLARLQIEVRKIVAKREAGTIPVAKKIMSKTRKSVW
jgi:transcriptional regulator with XRE-family HTH domain